VKVESEESIVSDYVHM